MLLGAIPDATILIPPIVDMTTRIIEHRIIGGGDVAKTILQVLCAAIGSAKLRHF